MREMDWELIEEGQQDPYREPDEDDPGIRYPHFRWRGD
ncbi:hypothetical protein LX73_1071 [Fodinibius salinus]|uniref:Uncharacterized protein n=1 Tax=Fodinibius salinus TaxID=860790 RepID=A0A5D3YMK2_9BACT|nr:hypothetical protein LX73_1071 [Fodinibius salinus]